MTRHTAILSLLIGALLIVSLAPTVPAAERTYVTGGRPAAPTVQSQAGAVTCAEEAVIRTDSGIGGACVPFPERANTSDLGGFVEVVDAESGKQVMFQVCIDNDGDDLCSSEASGECQDQIWLSHADDGTFHNPIGPLPGGFRDECDGGSFDGYVVILCQGRHDPSGGAAHEHLATTGTVNATADPVLAEPSSGDVCPAGSPGSAYQPVSVPFGVPLAHAALLIGGVAVALRIRRR